MERAVRAGGEADGQCVAALHFDLDGRGSAVQQVMDDGTGHGAGAAGECFVLDPAFVGADPQELGGDDMDKVGIGSAGGEVGVMAQGGAVAAHVDVMHIGHEDDGVGDAGVQRVDGQVASANGELQVEGERMRVAHAERDEIVLEFGADDAGDGFEADRRQREPVQAVDETGETARAVAAHLDLPAIGIVIAHPVVRVVLRRLDREQSVGADAAIPVAECGDHRLVQGQMAVAVVDQHEVVAGPVHLGETQGHVGFLLTDWTASTSGRTKSATRAARSGSLP